MAIEALTWEFVGILGKTGGRKNNGKGNDDIFSFRLRLHEGLRQNGGETGGIFDARAEALAYLKPRATAELSAVAARAAKEVGVGITGALVAGWVMMALVPGGRGVQVTVQGLVVSGVE